MKQTRVVLGLVLTMLMAGLATLVSLTSAGGSTTNTLTLSGKYHGTLTVSNPASECFVDEFSNSHLSDSVKLDMTGTLVGLKPQSWFFLATEPKQGTFTTKHTNTATAARLRPTNLNQMISFSQTSGTIAFNGKTGSVNVRTVFNNGYENTVTATMVGTWSCPTVHHL
jgi:hypothetical protein